MQCVQCRAEIADKAIVCYRCGTPTALPPAPERRPAPAGRHPWSLALASLALAAVAGWGAWRLEAGSAGQWAAVFLSVAWIGVAGFLVLRARRR